MKISFNSARALALATLLLFTTTSIAQKFGKPIIGLGAMNEMMNPIGFVDDYEIFSLAAPTNFGIIYRLYSYKDRKKVAQKEMVVTFNDKKYVPEGFVIRNKKMFGYFIAEDKAGAVTSLYFQEYSLMLEQVGEAMKIVELPKANDGNRFKAKHGSISSSETKYQDLDVRLNEVTGKILVVFSAQHESKTDKLSYAKVMTLDENFKVEKSQTYEAKVPTNVLKMKIKRFYDNNDALITCFEGSVDKKDFSTFMVNNISMIFVDAVANELRELELAGEHAKIRGVVAAKTLTAKGQYCYVMHTSAVSNDLGTMMIILFDPETDQVKEIPVNLSGTNFKLKSVQLDLLTVTGVFPLDNGDLILELSTNSFGDYAMRVSANGDVVWNVATRPEIYRGSAYSIVNGTLTTVKNHELILLYNLHPAALQNGKFAAKQGLLINFGSRPVLAKVDIESGEFKADFLNVAGYTIDGGVDISMSYELTNGDFSLRLKVNKKVCTIPLMF